MTAGDVFCRTRFPRSPNTEDNNSQSQRGQAQPNSKRDTDNLVIRSDSDLPGSRPATRHLAHEYFTISGCGRDPRGEVTRTLDDASESWTKANRENVGAVPTRGYRDKGCRWERVQRPWRGSKTMSGQASKSGYLENLQINSLYFYLIQPISPPSIRLKVKRRSEKS